MDATMSLTRSYSSNNLLVTMHCVIQMPTKAIMSVADAPQCSSKSWIRLSSQPVVSCAWLDSGFLDIIPSRNYCFQQSSTVLRLLKGILG
ncbi:hypothetical protein TNCV_4786531 [Trichonephila clavipes]|nr:hypothetical protein TNCV_4786531 [Trichonephila clavipes]